MKKLIHIIYYISIILFLMLIIYIQKRERIDEFVTRENEDYTQFTDYEFTTYTDPAAPIGIVQEYTWYLQDIPKQGSSICFYVIHQNVEIYVDNQLLYHLYPSKTNSLSKTVGCDWAKAFLNEEDSNKEVRILVYPIYETSIGNSLTIYTGDYGIICNSVIQNNIFILILGILAIIIGTVFVFFVLINMKNIDTNRSLATLGIFSISTGLWKITDMSAAPLLFKSTLTLSALAIVSLNIMLTSFILFVRHHFPKSRHHMWDYMALISGIECIVVIFLQFIGIADLRQTLFITHIVIIFVVLGILTLLTLELIHGTLSLYLKITIVCCTFCLLGTLIDLIMYYRSGESGNMIYCLLAFLLYVILMGYMTIKETMLLIERGKKAKKFEELALHDELTGLYNRAFYAQYLKNNNLQYRTCYIIMLDVNNLKQCNDTIGHEFGDQLIKNSARFIEEAFSQRGSCIRLGGDEFCVILKDCHENECKSRLKHFNELLHQFNSSHPECFPINIAYGYAHFDERLDFDYSDTLRRADRAMYQMKNEMKSAQKNAQN